MPKLSFLKLITSSLLLLSLNNLGATPAAFTHPCSITDTIPGSEMEERKIFDRVEIEASFPGGTAAWKKFLEQNVNAAVATENGAPVGAYTVVVQFVVDKNGKVSDIKALTNHGYGMEKEVIRIMKIAPDWTPAQQNGRIVKAYRKQPVTFQVIGGKKRKNRD